MKEFEARFKNIMKDLKPMKQADIDLLHIKTFTSKRNIKVGDYVLYGMLEVFDKVGKVLKLNMITFHKGEYGVLYKLSPNDDGISKYPKLVKI